MQAEDLSLEKRPAKNAEVLVLIATPAQKVISWATARLEPLIKTEQGRTLLSSILSTASRTCFCFLTHNICMTKRIYVAIAPPVAAPKQPAPAAASGQLALEPPPLQDQ